MKKGRNIEFRAKNAEKTRDREARSPKDIFVSGWEITEFNRQFLFVDYMQASVHTVCKRERKGWFAGKPDPSLGEVREELRWWIDWLSSPNKGEIFSDVSDTGLRGMHQ